VNNQSAFLLQDTNFEATALQIYAPAKLIAEYTSPHGPDQIHGPGTKKVIRQITAHANNKNRKTISPNPASIVKRSHALALFVSSLIPAV
jgi:hypothetical protein